MQFEINRKHIYIWFFHFFSGQSEVIAVNRQLTKMPSATGTEGSEYYYVSIYFLLHKYLSS